MTPEIPHYIPAESPFLKSGRWIRNIRDALIHADGYGADCGGANGAICCTCGIGLVRIWDTVCAGCGDTSCYAHSTVIHAEDKRYARDGVMHDLWFCESCAKEKLKIPTVYDALNA